MLGALGPGQLTRILRTAFDPYARAELAALEAADPARQGLSEANAWPLGAQEHWEHYRWTARARDVLDRRVAARRGLPDVHGRPAGSLERGADGGGHVRADRPRALHARGRGGDHPRPRRPRAAPPLRPGRDRPPAPGPGGRHAARGRARRRPRARSGWPASSRSRDGTATTCAGPAPRCTSRRSEPGSSCTGCTASRPMRSRSRCRSAEGCGELASAPSAGAARTGARPGTPRPSTRS